MNAITLTSKSSTVELRAAVGHIMTELRARKAQAGKTPPASTVAPSVPEVKVSKKAAAKAKTEKQAKRDADKAAYKAKKAEHASRPFGIRCVPTGSILKRRFTDELVALAQAASLTTEMKRAYEVISI